MNYFSTQHSTLKEINSCEVCGNDLLESVLNLGNHPLCDDLILVGESRICTEYPIEILFCNNCQTAHQRFQVQKDTLFPKTYHYRSRFTGDVLKGMSYLVDACESKVDNGLSGKIVLDIGCNDGSLLDFFRAKGAVTIGIEPTDAFKDALEKGHIIFNDYFSSEVSEEIFQKYGHPDVITFTNVFAHIENLVNLLNSLKILISSNTLLIIENHYLGSVINNNQFDTFYHEHPRTYSLNSFLHIARTLECQLQDVEFPARYGGNIRVFIQREIISTELSTLKLESALEREILFGTHLKSMQTVVNYWQKTTIEKISTLASHHGLLFGKAFPGRAAILVKLLNINADVIGAVYEKPKSMKIGHYLPGTKIPIKSDEDLFSKHTSPSVLINFAWHISSEIRSYLKDLGYTGEVIDILNPVTLNNLTK